jgi:uncharacterized membrane protein YedE/YeeE
MKIKHLSIFIGGLLFGYGLAISGMTKQELALSFLQLRDLGLLLVIGSAALVSGLTINLIPKILKRSFLGKNFSRRERILNKRTILGAIIFGAGWGISGQCPGSALASLGTGNLPILVGILSIFMGAYVMEILFGKT